MPAVSATMYAATCMCFFLCVCTWVCVHMIMCTQDVKVWSEVVVMWGSIVIQLRAPP